MADKKKHAAAYIQASSEAPKDSISEQAKRLQQYANEHGLTIEVKTQANARFDREELEKQALAEVCDN